LGKADLVQKIVSSTNLEKKAVERFLEVFTQIVREEVLVEGGEIRLRDFGTFKQKIAKARVGRNPRTGEQIQILGSTTVSFSPSASIKVKEEGDGASDSE
jgi:DNA-binding protein HU-beta